MFGHYVAVANWAWRTAIEWKPFIRDTIGRQLVEAADSVGANMVEGDGRHSSADSLRFFVIARASARETRYWIQCALDRGLISPAVAEANLSLLTRATQMLNSFIRYRRGNAANKVKEQASTYLADEEPFSCDLGFTP